MEVYSPRTGVRREYEFEWFWADDSYRTLCLKYGETSILMMEEVFITNLELSCILEGQWIVFDYDLNYLY